jgi:hypothetical protein
LKKRKKLAKGVILPKLMQRGGGLGAAVSMLNAPIPYPNGYQRVAGIKLKCLHNCMYLFLFCVCKE